RKIIVTTLNLGAIGNCSFSALVDPRGRIVWCCLPRFDGDPVFNALLAGDENPSEGLFSIELEGVTETEQEYEPNTAVLRTRLHGSSGSLEIVDCAPRFFWRDRIFRPQTLVRRIRPISGTPRISIRVRPTFAYGTVRPQKTRGSNHVRYVGPDVTLRLSTGAPIDYVLDETF